MMANDHIDKLTLELTSRCPNRCIHCSTESSPISQETIPISVAKSIVRQAASLGARKIILSGGEPLVYPHLEELLSTISEYGLFVVVYTSGSILSRDGRPTAPSQTFLESIEKLGVRRFNLSLHSHRERYHDWFMATKGSYARATNFLERVRVLGIETHTHCVVTRGNINDLLPLAEMLPQYGVPVLRLLRLVPQGRARKRFVELEPTPEDWQRFSEGFSDFQNSVQTEIRLGAHFERLVAGNSYECGLDQAKLLVEPNLRVSVCPALKGLRDYLRAPSLESNQLSDLLSSSWRYRTGNMKKNASCASCPAQELYKSLDSLLLFDSSVEDLKVG
jgi:MoaA/NifB/PqqE/SkfB family radical SAM enzyme